MSITRLDYCCGKCCIMLTLIANNDNKTLIFVIINYLVITMIMIIIQLGPCFLKMRHNFVLLKFNE